MAALFAPLFFVEFGRILSNFVEFSRKVFLDNHFAKIECGLD